MAAFWTALIYVFLAEMGDKTQLMTLGFSARYSSRVVLAGISVATALINLFSVGLGVGLGKILPIFLVNIIAGFAFILFGIWELKPEKDDDKEKRIEGKFGPFLTIAIAFFIAELGDKTMLAAVAIASRHPQFFPVWLGSTIGLVAANVLAIVAGKLVKDRLSAKGLRIAIAAVYIISGLVAISEGLVHRH